MYSVEFARSFWKDLRRVSSADARRVMAHIEKLKLEPFSHGVEKLAGDPPGYKVRVGDCRVLFDVDTSKRIVIVRAVAYRGRAYRRLRRRY